MTQAESGRAIFAFASQAAVDALLVDPGITEFVTQREFLLVVGLDAITNRQTLERLRHLEQQSAHLTVRVFWNRTDGLFHPKIAHFRRRDGAHILIVGSGNLTPGGLRHNIEAYSVLRTGPRERLNLAAWDDFLNGHQLDIRPIDDAALERAGQNILRGGRRRRDVEPDVTPPVEEGGPSGEGAPDGHADRILVAQVPAAAGRWHQVHFNADVVAEFFRIQRNTSQRLFLRERRPSGEVVTEQPRPLVLSPVNLNPKIELGARTGEDYPDGGRPIVVFRERGLRQCDYLMLMPGESGYMQMRDLTRSLPKVGRGVPRVITDGDTLRTAWPGCPLLLPEPGAIS